MADTAILLVEDEQDSCASLSDLMSDLDSPWTAPDATTSGLASFDSRPPVTDAAEATVRALALAGDCP